MASASPALHTTRPAGCFDLRKPGDYPIVLGKSLQGSDTTDQFLSLRYNWQPKYGFSSGSTSLFQTTDGYRLTVNGTNEHHEPLFKYSGHNRPIPSDKSEKPSALALVYDKADSVFKLELISKSVDLDLDSTSSQTIDVRRHPKLPGSIVKKGGDQLNGDNRSSNDDDTPDPTNPFDFRNFLEEAKENAEKSSHAMGSKTPIPGSRTPISGFASPIPGATRFKASTPQFHATSSPAPKRRKTDEQKASRLASPLRQRPAQKKRKALEESRQPLSKDRISDSDDELSDTIVVKSTSTPNQSRPTGHNRNISGGFGRSPHIVVNDGDLEIDMGSPPQQARGRPRDRINPDAFRSHTGTPVMGTSSNKIRLSDDLETDDPPRDHSEDGDIEELELGSPRTAGLSVHGSRSASIIEPRSCSVHEHAPTPPNQADDDNDDLLAAELEAALEEEDKEASSAEQAQGYGLGITGAAPTAADDDESEVSEEE